MLGQLSLIVSLIVLGAAQPKHTSECSWVGHGGITLTTTTRPSSLSLFLCAGALISGCHQLRSFDLPHPSAMMFLFWSQPVTDWIL